MGRAMRCIFWVLLMHLCRTRCDEYDGGRDVESEKVQAAGPSMV